MTFPIVCFALAALILACVVWDSRGDDGRRSRWRR